MSLILSKLCGPTSTLRTLMELELYVLRKASGLRPGEGRAPRPSLSGTVRLLPPSESALASTRPTVLEFLFTMMGSLPSSAVAGRSPLPLPLENRPWALGALATRRSLRASSSLVAVVARSAALSTTFTTGVSGGLGGTEPSLRWRKPGWPWWAK